ncbi:MAG: efflux RND transporter periplasmic adaptor subunit [Spirochaetaceae bacterium]|nr:efflux RND transporter periplasmic adaptor subunit [Spirochaetaceae bacterium]
MYIKKFLLALMLVMIFFLILGCFAARDENLETRSISQIHEEEGIPVRTMSVKAQEFTVALRHSAAVTGITESSASAMISDAVEQILFRVGDFVEKDTVVIRFPRSNPSANFFQARAAHENSRETFRRVEQLFRSGGVSRQDYDNAKTGYDVARANWDTVNKMVNVTAPISGYITRLDARVSENVSHGDHLFTVTNYDTLVGQVWIQERDISRVRNGLNAEATWEGNTIRGNVVQVDRSLNPSRQAFGAFIEFDNRDHKILSGVNADISIFIYESNSTIVIERKYLLNSSQESYVYIIEHGNRPIRRVVRTGWQSGENIEITHGLYEGDILITEGSRFITESSRIRVIAAGE